MLVDKKLVKKDDSLKVLRVHRRGLDAKIKMLKIYSSFILLPQHHFTDIF